MGSGRKAAALGLMVVCGWCASAADAFVGTAILGRVAWSPLARRLSGGAQSSVTHRRLGKNGEVYELKMGFLGWDIGADLGGGKGIRDMLGIISCEASHILVKGSGSVERCNELKEEVLDRVSIPMGIGIEDAFAEVAKEYSQCPSAKSGGSLGVFKPGQMVAEFDRAAFNGPILQMQGPIATQFGHHLILVKRRTGEPEAKKSGCG